MVGSDAAARAGRGGRAAPARYHAIVVDEGQDFDPEWLASLEALLIDGRDDVLYVFHDPAQAIYRDDAVAQLGLPTYPLETNCRNAQPIHAVVARFSEGGLVGEPLRTDGRAPEFIEAGDGPATVEALRTVLHRLRVEEARRALGHRGPDGHATRGVGRVAGARAAVRERGPRQPGGRRRRPSPRAGRASRCRTSPTT